MQTQSQVLYLVSWPVLGFWKAKLYSGQTCCKPLQIFLDSEKKKKKKRLVFGCKLPLVRLVPPKVLQKNYLLQNLHLKSAWNVVYQDFSGVSCFPPDFSHQFLPSSDCRMMLVQKCFDIKRRFFSFLNSFYLRSKLLKGFVLKCNIDEL